MVVPLACLMNNLGFASVALILLGAFVAGAHDMAFDPHGYLVVVLANISTAVYLTTIARIGTASSFFVTLFYLIRRSWLRLH